MKILNESWVVNLRSQTKWYKRMFVRRKEIDNIQKTLFEHKSEIYELKNKLSQCKLDIELLKVISNQYEYLLIPKYNNESKSNAKKEGFILNGSYSEGNYEVWVKK